MYLFCYEKIAFLLSFNEFNYKDLLRLGKNRLSLHR